MRVLILLVPRRVRFFISSVPLPASLAQPPTFHSAGDPDFPTTLKVFWWQGILMRRRVFCCSRFDFKLDVNHLGAPIMNSVAQHTYVLIAGAWHGAWAWRDVIPGLRKLGHEVPAPTLAGL